MQNEKDDTLRGLWSEISNRKSKIIERGDHRFFVIDPKVFNLKKEVK